MKALTVTVLFFWAFANLALAQMTASGQTDSATGSKRPYLRKSEIGLDFGLKRVSSYDPIWRWPSLIENKMVSKSFSELTQMSIGVHCIFKSRHKTSFGFSLYSDGYLFSYNLPILDEFFSTNGYSAAHSQQYFENVMSVYARYIYFGPIFDVRCGKKHQSHFYFKPTLGKLVYLKQRQTINGFDLGLQDYQINMINKNVGELSIGYRHDFSIGKIWAVSLDGSISRMTGGINLSQISNYSNISIQPNACRITLGVNKKPGRKLKANKNR